MSETNKVIPVKHVVDITNTCYVCNMDYINEHVRIDKNGAICLNCLRKQEKIGN